MLGDRVPSKLAQTRFDLLLLEDGEFFFDVGPECDDVKIGMILITMMHALQDFSVYRFLDSVPDAYR